VFSTLIFVRLQNCFCRFLFVIILALFFAAPPSLLAQPRCGTVEYTQVLKANRFLLENDAGFEKWLGQKLQLKARQNESQRTQATYQVPIVVHVIHNGEAVGSGTNISDGQILSQISVLNKDYNRLNSDAGNTPSEFLPLAGAFDVEFVLAKQNPEGLATSGIVRVQGTKTSWTMNDNYQLKSLSYWAAEDYLNIWVCDETDFLGYSQFPVSGLPGLENSSTNRLTDGVVISYTAFGSNDDGPFNLQSNYKKGRTTTHEVGHFFGLRHIWGDDSGDCSGSDYVNDTPNQSGSTTGCPGHPRITCTDVTAMFQNYLDYTNDDCMNLFTQGQAARMKIVIENSPRRASLTSSHGLNDPAPLVNDLGIKSIIKPMTGQCIAPVVPSLEVKNYGSNSVSSARIRVRKDGVITETKDFTFSPALTVLQSATVTFSALSFAIGSHSAAFEILLTNGVADPNTSNNSSDQDVVVPQSISTPIVEHFNSAPASWPILNPDQSATWQWSQTPSGGINGAMKMEFYNYEDHIGEIDALITPVFDLTSAPAALLKFDVAYARYQSSSDGLKVVLLNNCDRDISNGIVVYDKFGASLATTTASSSDFTPNDDQWKNEVIDLSAYIGQNSIQVAFVGFNDWGNNLYLDDISLTTTPIYDVVLKEVISPSPVTCSNQSSPLLLVHNAGTLINTLDIATIINGQTVTQSFSNLNLAGNSDMELQLTVISLIDGENDLSFEVSEPDGQTDFNPDDNTKDVLTIVSKANDGIPLRQNFETSFEGQWTSINPSLGVPWEPIDVSGNSAIYVDAFSNTVVGDQSWFVSPVLDFSDAVEASLYYDLSYAQRGSATDVFYILASTDCGNFYNDTLYVASGSALADWRTSDISWKPSDESDWSQKSHILSTLAGKSNVRIAFVFTNGNGNNIYLDNIEFFLSEFPIKVSENFSVYPNPSPGGSATISFNLPQKGAVTIDIIDSMGKTVLTETLTDILNQTYPFSLESRAAGVYLIRITTGESVYFEKLIVIN